MIYPEVLDLPPEILGDRQVSNVKYRLSSLVEHFGLVPQSGHYIAYKRLMPEQREGTQGMACRKWVQANDEDIQIVDVEQVLARNQGVYLLFYQRET